MSALRIITGTTADELAAPEASPLPSNQPAGRAGRARQPRAGIEQRQCDAVLERARAELCDKRRAVLHGATAILRAGRVRRVRRRCFARPECALEASAGLEPATSFLTIRRPVSLPVQQWL
jgi:hypothetical protein